ncbi:MAG: hypothetical protein EAX89_02420 [Candidatus Lokiarchaeota archaeon]|nr:hypothetical protein [Candidatus Lokiarchaeota archaeon]
MIVLENTYEESIVFPGSLNLIGLGIVSISEITHNIVYSKGIGNSLMKKMIQLYKKEILQKEEGKVIDLIGSYTVYVHFYKLDYEIIAIFYLNEKDKLVRYEDLCNLSKEFIKIITLNRPISEFDNVCKKAVPNATDTSALFIISSTGHSLFTKIKKNMNYLSENYIQIGGFISAIITFSNEVVGKHSGEVLEAISFENQQLYLSMKDEIIFAYLVEKSVKSKNTKRYIELLMEEFFMIYKDHIKDFNGDLSPFGKFEKVVDRYFVI